ncbi:hypothetical protein AAFF_G00250720 [Aldrovandia affinis]|uniref:Uncharacterized protein n=1 Tax=Aldrovandia affinis TaxID=143900 RepID=A0AAD7W339_9TELE|nr:hypothetical protein AAFF_G00250720 [Aldrovandia affinis]
MTALSVTSAAFLLLKGAGVRLILLSQGPGHGFEVGWRVPFSAHPQATPPPSGSWRAEEHVFTRQRGTQAPECPRAVVHTPGVGGWKGSREEQLP